MYNESERKNGGSCFADAIFRKNATPENYARVLTQRVLHRGFGKNSPFHYYETDTFFMITKDDQPIVVKDYQFVELKRCEDYRGFERWVEDTISNSL